MRLVATIDVYDHGCWQFLNRGKTSASWACILGPYNEIPYYDLGIVCYNRSNDPLIAHQLELQSRQKLYGKDITDAVITSARRGKFFFNRNSRKFFCINCNVTKGSYFWKLLVLTMYSEYLLRMIDILVHFFFRRNRELKPDQAL